MNLGLGPVNVRAETEDLLRSSAASQLALVHPAAALAVMSAQPGRNLSDEIVGSRARAVGGALRRGAQGLWDWMAD